MKNHPTKKATILSALAMLASVVTASAQSGTWTNTIAADGTNRIDTYWSDATNWLDAVVADGANNTAFFNATDLPTNTAVFVTVDDPGFIGRTIGNMYFGDNDTSGGTANWTLADGFVPLTLDNTASPNSIIDVNLVQGAANNLVTGWGTLTITPNLSGTNVLVKSGPSHLILNPTTANSHSGGVVISNGMVQLGVNNQAGTANTAAPGTGLITFRGGSLRLQNAAIPGNSPGNGGGGVPGLNVPVLVESGQHDLSLRAVLPGFGGR